MTYFRNRKTNTQEKTHDDLKYVRRLSSFSLFDKKCDRKSITYTADHKQKSISLEMTPREIM